MPGHRATVIALIAVLAASGPALAQPAKRPPVKEAPVKEWDISLGAAALMTPTFEGSDRYRVRALPFVSVNWRDTVSLDARGISARWKRGRIRLGGGVTFDSGRKDHATGGLFESGDDRLRGMGDIDFAVGLRGFANYRIGFVDIGIAATKFTGSQNDGMLATLGATSSLRLGKLLVMPNVRATWGDSTYNQLFFGVTPQQATRSRFTAFNAGSGIQNVSAGINLVYSLNRHWFLGANGRVTRLVGDAAQSPISFSDTSADVITTVGYRF